MQQFTRLVGIARLASEGSVLSEKRRVEYRSLPTRKWLNRCQSKRVPFDWTINPYRGCEFGCKYCYARYTHEFMEIPDLEAFETEIYAKDWCGDSFRRELRSVRRGQVIGLGTATDPYQPAERKFGRTRNLLEALLGVQGISLFVTTKSDLAARDADLFRELAKKNEVRVTFSVTTLNGDLTRLIEPFAPRPYLRIEAVGKLTAADVHAGVICSPVLPLITDSAENLGAVAEAAKAAGADQFGANVLFLQPSAQRVFFPFLAERFPEYVARYRREYASGAFLKGVYPEKIRQRVHDIRERLGLLRRDFEHATVPVPQDAQLLLF
ncbi:MAG TPA: radical SAM protein [Bryobacteraceae bacterium]|jgi:DNA repair photolyase|nr:radical SAM protein [Bryobacteraceae bacterium]